MVSCVAHSRNNPQATQFPTGECINVQNERFERFNQQTAGGYPAVGDWRFVRSLVC